jgi:outer membrane protein OmpA-like peptidoglycan-associated protein
MKTVEPTAASVASVAKTRESFFSKKGADIFFGKADTEQPSFFNASAGYAVKGNGMLQTKLTIGQPNDKYEQEADEMADKVVQRLANPSVQTKCAHCEEEEKKNAVQRKCAECEKEEELHTKAESSSTSIASPHVESSLNASKASGNPLPANTKSQMENSFGADFSNVRLHTDNRAAEMNQHLNAQAFTHGSDIYFNSGKYDTNSTGGKHLLAHELTHVVQQGESIKTKIQCLGDLTKVPPMPCDVANTSSAGVVAFTSLFSTSNAALTADQKNDISILVASWQASGASDTLRVDGYASTSGSDEFNWKLSCDRALAVAGELQINGVPNHLIEIFAQGETNEFGASANNQRAEITLIAAPPPPEIRSETVVTSPGSRARTTIGVGEEVNLTHSLGSATTAWTATAGTLSSPTGASVLFTAPDRAQNVTIAADGATITFSIVEPNNVHMDNVGGVVKHNQNFPDSGILTDVFLLPDNVNFNKVTYREIDAAAVTTGAYACHSGAEHCGPAGFGPCNDKAMTDTVIAGKGTKSVLGDCAYSGHCGGSAPFTPGIIMFFIPYEFKTGTGSFKQFRIILQIHVLGADASALATSKAGANGATTVGAPTALIAVCP